MNPVQNKSSELRDASPRLQWKVAEPAFGASTRHRSYFQSLERTSEATSLLVIHHHFVIRCNIVDSGGSARMPKPPDLLTKTLLQSVTAKRRTFKKARYEVTRAL